MSVLRQQNWLGQQRVDVPHLRAIDAGVAADFDLLAGRVIANKQPLVVKGFNIISTGAYGSPATELELSVAGSILIHHEATEGGSLFMVDEDADTEVLTSTNDNVSGSWTSNAVNYVSLDLIREADDTTADVVQFVDPDSRTETPKTTALGRVLKYRIYISTTPFSAATNLAPIAKVTLDSNGNVSAMQDARNMLFRLASGGDTPDRTSKFPWTAGRSEVITTNSGDPFSGGDRAIGSLKEWADAVMTRLWELGGGTYWYSAGNQFNVRMIRDTSVLFSNGENFEWDGVDLHWRGLKFVFDNATSSIYYNTVSNQTSDSPDLTDLADGECVYVDLDRTANVSVSAQKATIATLGMSTIPGQRFVIAWRVGSNVYTRDFPYAVGTTYTPATDTSVGVVRLNLDSATPATPDVAVTDGNGSGAKVIAAGISRGNGSNPTAGNGTLIIGNGSNDTTVSLRAADGLYVNVAGGALALEGDSISFAAGGSAISDFGVYGFFIDPSDGRRVKIPVNPTGSSTYAEGDAFFSIEYHDTIGADLYPRFQIVRELLNGEHRGKVLCSSIDAVKTTLEGSAPYVLKIGAGSTSAGVQIGKTGSATTIEGSTTGIGTSSPSGTVTISRSGQNTNIGGRLNASQIDVASAGAMTIGANTQTGLTLGRSGVNTSVAATLSTGGAITSGGDVRVPAASNHTYASAVTRHIHIPPSDIAVIDTTTVTGYGGDRIVSTGAGQQISYIGNKAGNYLQVLAKIAVPAGATVTAVQCLMYNNTGGAVTANLNVFLKTYTASPTTTDPYTQVEKTSSSVSLTNGSIAWYTETFTSTQVNDESFLEVNVSTNTNPATESLLRIYGIRVTYTHTNLTPHV